MISRNERNIESNFRKVDFGQVDLGKSWEVNILGKICNVSYMDKFYG